MEEKTSYLKQVANELNVIISKIEGEINEDFTSRECDIMRIVHDFYLKESDK